MMICMNAADMLKYPRRFLIQFFGDTNGELKGQRKQNIVPK